MITSIGVQPVSDAPSGLNILLEQPMQVPAYLTGSAEKLSLLAEPLAEIISGFLRTKATPMVPEITRQADSVHDQEIGPAFDTHFIDGDSSLRLTITEKTVDVLAPILFGGPLTEVVLRATVAQAVAVKVAETALMESGQGFGTPSLQAAGEDPLSPYPVLMITYPFDLGDKGRIDIDLRFARPFTDKMEEPCTAVPSAFIEAMAFEAKAIATKQMIPVRIIDSWKVGSIIPLRAATTERVTLTAFGAKNGYGIAVGEMGNIEGLRCLRLTEVGLMAQSSAAGASLSGFDNTVAADDGADEIEMNFAIAPDMPGTDDPSSDTAESDDFPEMASAFDGNDDADEDDFPKMASAFDD